MSKVLVTGGAGYVGSVLVPKLMAQEYGVRVLDTMWFGDKGLDKVKDGCDIVRGDVRDSDLVKKCMTGIDYVIHLANISNDPCSELDHDLTRQVNFEATKTLVDAAKYQGVSRFIYASSGSVYGIKDFDEVTEDVELDPLTIYSKTKVWSEEILKDANSKDFTTVSIRPATTFGYSPRQRLDLVVNIFTDHAVNKGILNVHGGEQMRPSISIEDITDCYLMVLTAPKDKIEGQAFNVSDDNFSVMKIAEIVRDAVGDHVDIKVQKDVVDQRSYPMVARKISETIGFIPKISMGKGVKNLAKAFQNGLIPNPDSPIYKNIQQMKKLGIGTKNGS